MQARSMSASPPAPSPARSGALPMRTASGMSWRRKASSLRTGRTVRRTGAELEHGFGAGGLLFLSYRRRPVPMAGVDPGLRRDDRQNATTRLACLAMAGTNHSRQAATGGPAIILVEPQLGENIGTA